MGAASINGLEMEVISIDQSGGNTISQNLWAELAIMSSKISINQAQVQTRTGRVGGNRNRTGNGNNKNRQISQRTVTGSRCQVARIVERTQEEKERGRGSRGAIDEGRQQQHSQMSTTMLTS